jgi:hypothetical protein
MAHSTTRLNVLAFRFTPDLAGEVRARWLPKEFTDAWRSFELAYKAKSGRDVQPAHSAIALALRGLLGGHAHFDPFKGELITEHKLEEQDLLDVFTLFQAFSLGEEPDLDTPSDLAKIVVSVSDETLHLGSFLDGGLSQPKPPGWVYETASWSFARALAKDPWPVDGLKIPLRPDTTGDIYAWDDLWLGTVLRPIPDGKRAESRHAMAHLRVRLKTLPNIAHPVLLIDGTATRISPTLRGVSTALVEQKAADAPLVRVALDGRITRHVNRPAGATLARLAVDRAVLDLADFAVDAATPARVRGLVPKSWRFAIGRGVGMHFHRELHRRVNEVFPNIRMVGTRTVARRLSAPRQGRIQADLIGPSLRAHGHRSLTVVCLWNKEVNRRRMLTELGALFDMNLVEANPADGALTAVAPEVNIVTARAEGLLAHGRDPDRATATDRIAVLQPGPGELTVVLCETDSDHGARVETEESEPATEEEARAAYQRYLRRLTELSAEDAKPQVRRLLARRGIVSQFLDQPKPTRKRSKPAKHDDYPALAAVTDLLRSAGLTDDRFTHILGGVRIGELDASRVAHVGIHVRQQNKRGRAGTTKLVVTMTALIPPGPGQTTWALRAWTHRDRSRWEVYPQACAAFHATPLEPGSRSRDDLARLAGIVEHALGTLTDSHLGSVPYVVYADGFASRGVWPGLLNTRQGVKPKPGRPWLPGATLPRAQRPLATVRINAESEETTRPVSATTIRRIDGVPTERESKTVNRLVRIETDFGSPVYWLSRVPVQFDGAGSGRLGEYSTRWRSEPGPEVRRTWYSMNTVEIYPIAALPGGDLESLAVTAALLCRQTSGWDGQTTYPEPVHLARQLDLDHPEYRADEFPDDPESAMLAHDE